MSDILLLAEYDHITIVNPSNNLKSNSIKWTVPSDCDHIVLDFTAAGGPGGSSLAVSSIGAGGGGAGAFVYHDTYYVSPGSIIQLYSIVINANITIDVLEYTDYYGKTCQQRLSRGFAGANALAGGARVPGGQNGFFLTSASAGVDYAHHGLSGFNKLVYAGTSGHPSGNTSTTVIGSGARAGDMSATAGYTCASLYPQITGIDDVGLQDTPQWYTGGQGGSSIFGHGGFTAPTTGRGPAFQLLPAYGAGGGGSFSILPLAVHSNQVGQAGGLPAARIFFKP